MTQHTDTIAIRLGTTLDDAQDVIAEIWPYALITDEYDCVFDEYHIVSFTLVPRAPHGLIARVTRALRRLAGKPDPTPRWVAAMAIFDGCTADADFTHNGWSYKSSGVDTWTEIEPDNTVVYDAQAGTLMISAEDGETVRVDANGLRELLAQMHRILDEERAQLKALGF